MLALAIALPLLWSAAPAVDAASSDEADIRKTFSQYREALLKKDGHAAAATVDADTLAYYAKMRELALSADAATTRKQSMIDRIMILRLRHEIGFERVNKMSGRDLFVYAVDQGWVSPSSVEKASLGTVKISGNEGHGELVMGEKPAPFNFLFKKTEQGWRFSLLPMLALGEPAMQQMAKQAGQEENAFVFTILEKISGKRVPETVWEPLAAKTKPTKAK